MKVDPHLPVGKDGGMEVCWREGPSEGAIAGSLARMQQLSHRLVCSQN